MMKLKSHLLLLVCAISYMFAYSQTGSSQGGVTIIKDERINRLQDYYISVAKKSTTLDGFRVQIFFDSGNQSKRNAMAVREKFLQQYPGIEAYIDFREPFYRIRVGDFRTRLEAEGFRRSISGDYPNGFTVNEKINSPSIH
ncbi:MAG: SPOR domain-containing protein [Bacteroidales bacterium]|nr:SPOR domain-containing protein [Bacteroidales bacterium]MDZ4205459.1 SPOR domain-containing protein [Bacteroidales bacterium]